MEELLKKLVEERGRTWHQAKALLDGAQEAKRDLDGPEQEQWERMTADLDKLDERIDGLNERLEREAAADEARAKAERFIRPSEDPKPETNTLRDVVLNSKSFEVSFAGLRAEHAPDGRVQIKNVLTEGTASEGGDTVPTSFRRSLYEHLIENTAIRQTNVQVITTASGESLLLPKTTAHTGAGTVLAEGGTLSADDPTFGQATLTAYKYPRLVQLSSELVQDTAVDLEGYLARSFGQALANGSGGHFITGTGSGQPKGILTGGSVGVTGSNGTAVGGPTADNLIDLYFSVIEPHASNGWWIMSRASLGLIRKLKDGNGQFLWQPGLAGSSPNTILDRPYVTDPNMPAAATSATSVAFGDFSAYVIRDVGSVRFERSDDFAFDRDFVTFRAILRTDGQPLGANGEWQVYKGGTA